MTFIRVLIARSFLYCLCIAIVVHRALHVNGKRFNWSFLTPVLSLCSIALSSGAEATMPKRQTLSLRVSADFKRRLFEEAKRDKRSVTNYIEVALTRLWHEE